MANTKYIKTNISISGNSTVGGNSSVGGNLSVTGIFTSPPQQVPATKTGNYTVSISDNLVKCDSSGGTFVITFPSASGNNGQKVKLVKVDASLTPVTFSGGPASGRLSTQGEYREYISDGTNWILASINTDTDWKAYTPTPTAIGTVNSSNFWYRRDGDSVYIRGRLDVGAGGTGADAHLGLPAGLTVDAAKNTALFYVGNIQIDSVNNTTNNIGSSYSVVAEAGDAFVSITFRGTAIGGLVKEAGSTLDGGVSAWDFFVPITGWGK